MAHRAAAARAVDQLAAKHGPLLVWRTVLENRTTPDCGRLNGTIFDIRHPPGGKYPGEQHARCRCFAVAVSATTKSAAKTKSMNTTSN